MYCVQKYQAALRKFNFVLNWCISLLVLNVPHIISLVPVYRRIKICCPVFLPVKRILFLNFSMYVAPLLAVDGNGRPPPVL